MVQKIRTDADIVDCACLIHGNVYKWEYVDHLYNMLKRNIGPYFRLHVYTEPNRAVPDYMIKHELENCPPANKHKKGWWYKMQLFNQQHFAGNLLYLDLDVVIVRDLNWIFDLPANKLWAVRDFKHLQNEFMYSINSSVMWWNVPEFDWVWQKFKNGNIETEVNTHKGDQDYLETVIGFDQRRYFPDQQMISWRWQAWNGGKMFPTRWTKNAKSSTTIPDTTSVLIFHGQPKPHELLDDVVIKQHWC